MDNPLKFCLVGRGSIGTRHLKNLKAHYSCEIVAYSHRSDAARDREYRDSYAVETLHSLDQVRQFSPDVFIIANPTARHIEIAEHAVAMGSHVFMEKPLSDSMKSVERLNEELKKKNLVFLLANNFRFHPVVTAIKKLIADGVFPAKITL